MSTSYKISVITPFHNVPEEVFQRAYQSMLKQTIGFENLEWIVVLHNCEDSYKDYMHKLLAPHKNVRLEVLDNEIYTPSSPRNYAFPFAHGDFIGYLDADDAYTPRCLEKALETIEKNDADIVSFRREYETEQPTEQVLNEIVLWNQTETEIIISPDSWDDKKIFAGIWGIVTSKLYRKSFLEEHNLTFDPEIPFAESFAFTMAAYVKARRICLLPQFIGYTYFIRQDSLVQDTNKDPQELVAYARGFKKIFDMGLAEGIYMNDIMTSILYHMAWFISKNEAMDDETLGQIQELLTPYVTLLRPLPVSKLYSKQDSNLRYTFTRKVLLNAKDSMKEHTLMLPDAENLLSNTQARVLEKLIRQGQDTDLGRRFHFARIFSIENYQDRVSLLDYDFYEPMINLMLRVGEHDIFTHESPKAYVVVRRKDSAPSYLPVTDKLLHHYVKQFSTVVEGEKSILLFESYAEKISSHAEIYADTCFGQTLNAYTATRLNAIDTHELFSAPLSVLFPKDFPNLMYYQLFFALLDENATQIIAPNTLTIQEYLYFVIKHAEEIASDIEAGHISRDDELATILNQRITPHKKRAATIREAMAHQDLQKAVRLLWPKLSKIIAEGVGPYEPSQNLLEKIFPHVEFYNLILSLPEAPLTKAPFQGSEFPLNQEAAFYEFIIPGNYQARPLLLEDLEPGTKYELIISNNAGLYRYKTHALLRYMRDDKGEKYFTYLGRQSAY